VSEIEAVLTKRAGCCCMLHDWRSARTQCSAVPRTCRMHGFLVTVLRVPPLAACARAPPPPGTVQWQCLLLPALLPALLGAERGMPVPVPAIASESKCEGLVAVSCMHRAQVLPACGAK
jgi:hypothetical protein